MAEVTTTHLRAFLVHLRENVKTDENNPAEPAQVTNLSSKTIQGYARTLEAFFTWASHEGYLPQNPSERLKVPQASRVLIMTLTSVQIKQLLSVIDQRTRRGFRDYSIILTLLDTGIRLSELVNLQIDNTDLGRGFFKVMGNGARERLVLFGAKVQTTLKKYIQKHRPPPAHPNQRSVFLGANGQAFSTDLVYRMVRAYGERAGLKEFAVC